MAVAHDTATRFPANADATVGDTTTGDRTFDHAAAAGADGAVVIILSDTSAATVTGVLYGGTAMAPAAEAADTSEAGHVQIFFLNLGGLGLGGTQTVTLQGCAATLKAAYCHTCTSATGYTDLDGLVEKNTTTAANPTANLTVVANAMVYGGVYGGAAAPASYVPGTGEEVFTGGTGAGIGLDGGANSGHVARSTAATSAGTYTINWSFATSDDYCVAAVSVKESAPVVAGQAALSSATAVAAAAPAATSTAVARVSLEGGGDPETRTLHKLVFRARKQSGTGSVRLNAALYEGANNRSGDLISGGLTTSVAEYSLAIADASAATITSYSDLEVRFWATSSTGDTVTVEVGKARLATPAAGATVVTGQAAINPTAAVDVTPQRIVQRQVDIGSTADIAAVSQRTVQRQADVGASATVDAAPQRIVQRQVAAAAAAAVEAAGGRLANIVAGQASLDATADVAAAPQRSLQRQASVDAAATVAAVGGSATFNVVAGQASLDAAASVEAAGRAAIVSRQATLSAAASVEAAGRSTFAHGVASISAATEILVGSLYPAADLYPSGTLYPSQGIGPARGFMLEVLRQTSLDAATSVEAAPQRIVQRQVSIVAAAAVAAAPAVGDSYRQVMAGLSPTHYWQLDEPSGTQASDSAGTAHGTYVNAPTLGVAGLIAEGTAVTFASAQTECVSVPDNSDWEGQTSLSIALVVKPTVDFDAASLYPLVFRTGSDEHPTGAGDWGFSLWDGDFYFGIANGSSYPEATVAPPNWTSGQRYHIAVVWTGSVVRFYRDGVQIGTDQSLAETIGTASSAPLRIGAADADSTTDATFDEVAYWKNAALTSQNVADLYAAMDAAAVGDIVAGQASIGAAAAVEAAGGRIPVTVTGQASIDVAAAVAAVPQRAAQRQAAVGAAADVAAVGGRLANIVTGQASLDATSNIDVAPRRVVHRQVAVAAAAAVTAAGFKAGMVTGQAAISAAGSVAAAPQRTLLRQAALGAAASADAAAVSWSTVTADGAVQATATVAAVGVALQVLRPSADSVDGDWTTDSGGTNLVGAVGEAVPDDGTYIHSGASSPSTCRIKLSGGQIPVAGSRTLRLRAGNEAPGADLTVRLREGGGDVVGGGVLVNEFVHTDIGSVGDIADTVTGTIVDYSDLYVELEAA